MTTTRDEYVAPGYGQYRVEMEAKALLANVRNGTWLNEQTFAPLRWMVPDLVPEGASLLVGGPKTGKSWFAYGMGLGVAAGGVVLGGVHVERRPVFMLALEDGDRRLQQRGRLLMQGQPLPSGFDYLTRVEQGQVVRTVEAWLHLLPNDDPEPLVIIDTLGKAMPPAESNESTTCGTTGSLAPSRRSPTPVRAWPWWCCTTTGRRTARTSCRWCLAPTGSRARSTRSCC